MARLIQIVLTQLGSSGTAPKRRPRSIFLRGPRVREKKDLAYFKNTIKVFDKYIYMYIINLGKLQIHLGHKIGFNCKHNV